MIVPVIIIGNMFPVGIVTKKSIMKNTFLVIDGDQDMLEPGQNGLEFLVTNQITDMLTFIAWWLVGSVIGVGINYVIMRDTDNDED